MSSETRAVHPIHQLLPMEIEGFDSLAELALDLRWSWNHATDQLWRQLDAELWKNTDNPWVVLQTVSRDKLERSLADPAFRKTLDDLLLAKRQAAEAPAWFQQHHAHDVLTCVAYFSMEFMLSEALPIYSGGLGNVAGDQLKAASDLGVPVVGVGLLYQQGYFRQVIDKDGAQQALYPYNEVPVGHITNGVHVPSWDSAPADDLWTEACGQERWLGETGNLEEGVRHMTDARLRQFRSSTRRSFIEYTRERLARQLAASGASLEAVEAAKHLLDPNVLTLGFARRFAAYKRPNLLLHDPELLLRLLTNPERPVQLILAGKAHPADGTGQTLIREWTHFRRMPGAGSHVVFLRDYDMQLAGRMVQGMDVWLNTPQRPWEACGTSGMKVLVNGGINCSELDGWWAEAYAPDLGWSLGDGHEHGDDPAWDRAEAEMLYDALENEIVPEFYTRDEHGIPAAWVARMRESMARLTPRFSADRAVREYTEKHNMRAAAAYRCRAANGGSFGKHILEWQDSLEHEWDMLRFGDVNTQTEGDMQVFEVQIRLYNLDPEAVRVELYANGGPGGIPVRQELKLVRRLSDEAGGSVYYGAVNADRPASDYTLRVVPCCAGVAVPLENARILWQR